MARQDNVKIITTALLVVLLLSSFIFGFVYRNEIYQKFQSISKSNSTYPEERVIEKEPAWTPPVETPKVDEKDQTSTKKTELADIPPLDEMEENFQKPSTSISVTQPHTLKKNKKSEVTEETATETEKVTKPSITEKINKIEEKIANPNSEKAEKQKPPVVAKKQSEPKKQNTYKNKKVTSTKSKFVASNTKKFSQKQLNTSTNNASLEARIKSMESKFVLQNQKNDQRFIEIEKRIDKLEKSLGSN